MIDRSAHLVDRVIPFVPIRQWVLSLPFELRHRLAWDHPLCREVLGVFTRALRRFYVSRARARGVQGGRTGSITVIQRAGAALNLNIHFHVVGLDGVFTEGDDGALQFHPAGAPTDAAVAELLDEVVRGVVRRFERLGLLGHEAGDVDAPEEAQLYAASAQGIVTTGIRAGRRPARLRSAAMASHAKKGQWGARQNGFDLHAGPAIRARRRRAMEHLCRYVLRPPVAEPRLEESGDRVLLRLIRPWRDGSTHVVFEPVALLERLAALVPRPHKNTTLYHGVLAAHSAWRSRVVAYGRPSGTVQAPPAAPPRSRNAAWSDLMRRGLDLDVLACLCGGRFALVSTIADPRVAHAILRHLGLLPATSRARAPPEPPPPSPFKSRLESLAYRVLRDLPPETCA